MRLWYQCFLKIKKNKNPSSIHASSSSFSHSSTLILFVPLFIPSPLSCQFPFFLPSVPPYSYFHADSCPFSNPSMLISTLLFTYPSIHFHTLPPICPSTLALPKQKSFLDVARITAAKLYIKYVVTFFAANFPARHVTSHQRDGIKHEHMLPQLHSMLQDDQTHRQETGVYPFLQMSTIYFLLSIKETPSLFCTTTWKPICSI